MIKNFMFLMMLVVSTHVYALSYSIVNWRLILSGDITKKDLTEMPKYLTNQIDTVVFDSVNGGDAGTTLELLPLFEARPRVHIVSGFCESSCVIMFLAGTDRISYGIIGLHSVYSYDTNKINPHLSHLFNKYVEKRLGSKYDKQLFSFVFNKMIDHNELLIFSKNDFGKLCGSDSCGTPIARTAEELGLTTDKHFMLTSNW
jgi:hypothetical protein